MSRAERYRRKASQLKARALDLLGVDMVKSCRVLRLAGRLIDKARQLELAHGAETILSHIRTMQAGERNRGTA